MRRATGKLLVVSWGGTYGACATAVQSARNKGASVSHAHLRHLNPFPGNLGEGGLIQFSVGYPYTGPAPQTLVGARLGQTQGGATLRAQFNGRRSLLPPCA